MIPILLDLCLQFTGTIHAEPPGDIPERVLAAIRGGWP